MKLLHLCCWSLVCNLVFVAFAWKKKYTVVPLLKDTVERTPLWKDTNYGSNDHGYNLPLTKGYLYLSDNEKIVCQRWRCY